MSGAIQNKRSCKRCSERKVRCDRNSPCGACVKEEHPCTFPGPKRAPRTLNRPPVGELLARLTELEEEVQRLRSEHHESDEHSSKSSSVKGGLGPLAGLLGHSNHPSWSNDLFRRYYLQPLQIEALWRIYSASVAPLIAVLHLPTTARIVQDATKGRDIDPAREALLISVCFAAVVSMHPNQLQSELGLEYHKAKAAYEHAVDQALSRADFVKSPGIFTLQAAVLYLLCARVDGDTRLVWAESAAVIRLAQSQGTHRDGTKTGLSPFDTEIRRRLWWHICILDMLCSEDQGVDMQIRPGTFDAQFPVNVNGDELDPLMLELPPEDTGFTDITLCITTSFMIMEVYLLHQPLDPIPSLDARQDQIKSVGRTLHNQYLNHFDLGVPIHWVSATITRLHLLKLWVSVHSQLCSSSDSGQPQLQYKDSVFRTAVELAEFAHFLQTNDVTAQWGWLCRSYKQKEAISYVLDELSSRAPSPEMDRAWEVVTKTTSLWRQGRPGTGGEPEAPLLELIRRADLLREGKLGRLPAVQMAGDASIGEDAVSGSYTNPSTIAWLQGIWPYEQINEV
ncbi:fungal-specific transcription factor domain-containing protein [Aspergillus varians]